MLEKYLESHSLPCQQIWFASHNTHTSAGYAFIQFECLEHLELFQQAHQLTFHKDAIFGKSQQTLF